MGRTVKILIVAMSSAALAACAHAPKLTPLAAAASPPSCTTGGEKATAELVFARVASDRPGRGVSEAQFAGFVSQEIASRFHDGLTVLDAQDLSPKPGGGTIYGPAKVVMIVLPGHADDSDQLTAIRNAYQRRFDKTALLEMTRQDCVTL